MQGYIHPTGWKETYEGIYMTYVGLVLPDIHIEYLPSEQRIETQPTTQLGSLVANKQ